MRYKYTVDLLPSPRVAPLQGDTGGDSRPPRRQPSLPRLVRLAATRAAAGKAGRQQGRRRWGLLPPPTPDGWGPDGKQAEGRRRVEVAPAPPTARGGRAGVVASGSGPSPLPRVARSGQSGAGRAPHQRRTRRQLGQSWHRRRRPTVADAAPARAVATSTEEATSLAAGTRRRRIWLPPGQIQRSLLGHRRRLAPGWWGRGGGDGMEVAMGWRRRRRQRRDGGGNDDGTAEAALVAGEAWAWLRTTPLALAPPSSAPCWYFLTTLLEIIPSNGA
uniref:Uncharacterized protein n=1 Tax=Oryza sativa subsp. japonica TaxID=39947 RepID=Q33BA0_ORYSJ|nr:hypothetical protein LOC_Os10g03820 [Oryza sativa Japonica Group]